VTAPASNSASAHCLVVDDDAQVRHALAKVIEAHGLATIEASSGADPRARR
jgi:CheY-like chemotaxis protein